MITRISDTITKYGLETVDQFANKLGVTSVGTSVGLTSAEVIADTSWALTDYALLISAIGGIFFIIEKIFVIYLRYKESKILMKQATNYKKRNLPK